jgi:hypothetical protein
VDKGSQTVVPGIHLLFPAGKANVTDGTIITNKPVCGNFSAKYYVRVYK